jgi:hypothetical protein
MFASQLHGTRRIETLKQQSKAVVLSQSTEAGAELNESDLEQVQGGINWGDARIDPYKNCAVYAAYRCARSPTEAGSFPCPNLIRAGGWLLIAGLGPRSAEPACHCERGEAIRCRGMDCLVGFASSQ